MSDRWHPVYRKVVLEPGFANARAQFFYAMMEITVAHVLMLMRQRIIDLDQGRAVLAACQQVMEEGPEAVEYDPRYEDLFFKLEAEMARLAGDEAVGNMHVGMSRNDMDTAMYRIVLRQEVLDVLAALTRLRAALLDKAAEHVETVMVAHTHNQQAQPTTLGHYLAAVEAEFAKDTERLLEMWPRLNRSPLGAGALATSGYPVDRDGVAKLLGFEGLVENSYEAVASADFTAEYAACLHIALGHVSRFVTDLLFWCTNEVAAVRLPAGFVQISSIMPQKRNPVALEHIRAFATRAMGDAVAVLNQMHNVPFGDINDVNDDVQPVVRRLTGAILDILELLTAVVESLEVDRELLHRRAADGFAAVTELADTLVRHSRFPFRTAHKIASRVVDELTRAGRTLRELDLTLLDQCAQGVAGRPSGLDEELLQKAIDPVHFVAVRKVRGGPAPEEMTRYLQAAKARREAHDERLQQLRRRLDGARAMREQWMAQALQGGMPGA